MNDWLAEAIEDLDVEDLTIAVLGSHSALEVARGARDAALICSTTSKSAWSRQWPGPPPRYRFPPS